MAEDKAPSRKERVRDLAERLGIAFCVRALLDLIEELIDHRGII